MTELLTAAQMRAIEQAAIESGNVTGLELMERAGLGVVEAIFEEWPELAESEEGGAAPRPADSPRSISKRVKRAVVLCGPGNNGGDGFVVARLLCELGWELEVFLYGDPEKLPPDAKTNYDRWIHLGGVSDWSLLDPVTCVADLIVDAMFGAGLSRAPSDRIMAPVTELFTSGCALGNIVAVDAPTGLCMDSGRALSDYWGAVYASLTVTFHRPRRGHHLDDGPHYCGKVVCKQIDLNDRPSQDRGVNLVSVGSEQLSKGIGDHKFDHGHAVVLSGGTGRSGAARLAARGALRIGAGLVTLGVPPSAMMEVAGHITALMMARVEGGEGLGVILEDPRLNALCLGPGLGQARARDVVPVALAAKRATVLDADALSAFADDPEMLFSQVHKACVLTPHGGEFARLFPDIADKLNEVPINGPAYSKVDATRAAAKRAGCVVLFKGADTVIADPDGHCSVSSAQYERSAPWLATAGSGDVLAGFITGLLARGFKPMQAAETAAWLHVECALEFGPGLIAEDLPEQLPAVFRKLGV
ncbi:NAD(P)H-hydrate dehydratase [Tropicibacter sp. Alg240-R139]|uniref:NAD(P)H-hydrate dehydratase n=1 Tax=Tropicibacter sp. Alg240-R139 TaxID=2305991 RepID=UPI0013DFF82A|nr:NAD(P)H-hydrate dehydratase [Tropicibacter sp. Alg240-R139]